MILIKGFPQKTESLCLLQKSVRDSPAAHPVFAQFGYSEFSENMYAFFVFEADEKNRKNFKKTIDFYKFIGYTIQALARVAESADAHV